MIASITISFFVMVEFTKGRLEAEFYRKRNQDAFYEQIDKQNIPKPVRALDFDKIMEVKTEI
jgi:hypothetical protein